MSSIGRMISVFIALFVLLFGVAWLIGVSIWDYFMPFFVIIVALGIIIVLILPRKEKPSTIKKVPASRREPASRQEPTTREIIREREVIKEIVMIPCEYCRGLMPQTSTFCPNCGARRKA